MPGVSEGGMPVFFTGLDLQCGNQVLFKPYQRSRMGELFATDKKNVFDTFTQSAYLGVVHADVMLIQDAGDRIQQSRPVGRTDVH